MTLDMTGDFIDPATENWREIDDAALWHAAQAKVPQAVVELARRERENTPPITSSED